LGLRVYEARLHVRHESVHELVDIVVQPPVSSKRDAFGRTLHGSQPKLSPDRRTAFPPVVRAPTRAQRCGVRGEVDTRAAFQPVVGTPPRAQRCIVRGQVGTRGTRQLDTRGPRVSSCVRPWSHGIHGWDDCGEGLESCWEKLARRCVERCEACRTWMTQALLSRIRASL